MDVWKNIKWERGDGDRNFRDKNQDFKKKGGEGEENQVVGNVIHPCN